MSSVFQPVDNIIGTDIAGKKGEQAAINAQTHATEQANETQKYMYDTTRSDLEPWRKAGGTALGDLSTGAASGGDFNRDFTMADFQADPGYAFRMAEGQKAVERSAAARGSLNSGRTLKELTRYGQNVASDEYTNAYNRFNADRDRRFNRLSSIAGIGQTATGQLANAGQNYANNVSANQIGLGDARASAYMASANRDSAMIGQAMGAAGTGVGAYYGYKARVSDERLKKNIELISKEDLIELKSAIKPYKFNYIDEVHGAGDWIGVMAQDLEKSKLGKTLVQTSSAGFKFLDLQKVMCLFLATLAEG